jgi:hypothetical protein
MELGQDCVQFVLGISSVGSVVSTLCVLLMQCILPPLLAIYCLVVPGERTQVQ